MAEPFGRPRTTPREVCAAPAGVRGGPRTSSKPDSYAWIPFGGGVRRCLGATFAEFEMRIVLREVLGRCELRKASPAPEQTGRRNITLSPKDGTPVVLEARAAAAAEPEPVAAV